MCYKKCTLVGRVIRQKQLRNIVSYYAFEGLIPVVHPQAYVHPSAVLIGDVIVGAGVYIGPLASLRGDYGRLILEAGSNLQDGCIMHGYCDTDTIVHENGHIGHGAILHGCVIGNRVLVGMGSILLDGVVVEDDVMIGAGSLVPQNKRLESGYLYLGSPVKQIRPLSDEEKAGLQYSANNYVKWKDEYLSQDNQTQP